MTDEFDENRPDESGWLVCPTPPAEAYMVGSMWSKSGHFVKDFVDASTFPPKVNEGLFADVIEMYGENGVLFNDGSGEMPGKGISREAWKESHDGQDPLIQLAWQRTKVGVHAHAVEGAGTVTIERPNSPGTVKLGKGGRTTLR